MPDRIYLDHAATTPMRPEAIAAVEEGMRRWANPSSPHAEGRAARAALEDARARIKRELGWAGELLFTSGASEALAIALGRAQAGCRLISAMEHDAVFRAAPEATVFSMEGGFPGEDLDALLARVDRPVVALQHVNSETGDVQSIGHWASSVRKRRGILVCDCAQSAGKEPLPDADLIAVSAHKFGGPPGIGALLVRDLSMLGPTGGQEFGYRHGTENLPGALGFAAALEAPGQFHREPELPALAEAIANLSETISEAGGEVLVLDWMFIVAITMPNLSAAAQLVRFDLEGFAVSIGSACSSGSLKPSRALLARGVPEDVASRTIRMSIGWSTTPEEIELFGRAWVNIASAAKKCPA